MPAIRLPAPRFLLRSLPALALASLAQAQPQAPASIADLSLEQLTTIEVTSVGKRVQRLADVPGSVYVITQEDVRRSGAVSLPEILRLAPNLHVARADANQYAITARGFASVLANKMLVMIDGRTVYSPLFSGVFWELHDMVLSDIERIEVLSGSGGTLYGSNAVNGVINIITRSASETTGTLVRAVAGSNRRSLTGRFGAVSDAGPAWRVFAKQARRDATELASGAAVRDAARHDVAGFRGDFTDGARTTTVQGDVYRSRIEQAPQERRVAGHNLLARHAIDFGPAGQVQLQAYYDRNDRFQPGQIDEKLQTWDLEFQHLLRPASSHELLWGAGYRLQDDQVENLNPAVLAFRPGNRRLRLSNVFAQDEVALGERLRLTLGLKAEHNAYTGLEWLPTIRATWEFVPQHLLWGALSRTVRTPSRVDRDLYITPTLTQGGANFVSEVARVAEVGYRAQPRTDLSYAMTLFHHDFDRLRSVDAAAGGISLNNNYRGRLTGLEAWGRWRVSEHLRFNAGYVHQRMRFEARPGTAPIGGTAQLGNDPRQRLTLGASWDLGLNMELDLQARRVGSLPSPHVPAYSVLDARWGWRVRPDVELALTVNNVGDRRHAEFGGAATRSEFGRSAQLSATWRR